MSTLELARSYYQSSTRESHNSLTISHDLDLKIKLFRTVRIIHEHLGHPKSTKREASDEIVFDRLQSSVSVVEAGATEKVASNKGRSGTVHRLHATEVAFWRSAEDTMRSVLGSMPNDAEICIESTANGAAGYYYNLCQAAISGDSEYKFHFYPWYVHAEYRASEPDELVATNDFEELLLRNGIDGFQLRWWRSKVALMTLDGALQEYPIDPVTCFRASGRTYISPSKIDALVSGSAPPIAKERLGNGWLWVYSVPRKLGEYVIGADISGGTGQDATAAVCVDVELSSVCAVYTDDASAPGDAGLALAEMGRRYNNALLAVERNNHGAATLRALSHEARYSRVYSGADKKPGILTTSANRPVYWEHGRKCVESGDIQIRDLPLIQELKGLVWDEGDGQPRAAGKGNGGRDDRAVALWLALWAMQRPNGGLLTASKERSGGFSVYY